MLIVGTIGSFAIENRWADAVSNHLGGLGVVGLLLPVTLGALAVFLVILLSDFVYCGGGVILLSSMLIIIGYSCLRKREIGQT
jgi:hypothetical protein